jgi:hypothetical protein
MTMKNLLAATIVVVIVIGCGDDSGPEEASNGDYIDITSVEPGVVTEGEEVSFTINLDYRLVSVEAGAVWVGFNYDPEYPDRFMVNESFVIGGPPVEGTKSITITTHPIWYEQPDNYNIYVNLSPLNPSSYRWTPLSVDTWPIEVNQGVGEIIDDRTGLCTDCDFVECSQGQCPD